jgi:CRP-like cAMP-binding protein
MFGEIAYFAPDRKRSGSARCTKPSTVMSIDEAPVKQPVHQNSGFSLDVVRLIAGRLSRDVQRPQREEGPQTSASS